MKQLLRNTNVQTLLIMTATVAIAYVLTFAVWYFSGVSPN